MCVACHPTNPSWIAGGTFNGEVIVWDTGRTDDFLIATSGIGDDSHREPVAKLEWVIDPDSKGQKYHLVSVSGDGRILMWQLLPRQQPLKLIDGFVLLTESLPRQLRSKAGANQQMGVTCLSFSRDDETLFLIGSESGGIFRCSTLAKGTAASKDIECSIQLRSPVSFSFAAHQGPVHGVECSPFHRNLFVSCSTDTSVRIYSVLQNRPIVTLEPNAGYLQAVNWSPVRPMVLAVAAATGQLCLYDLQHSRSAAALQLDASPKRVPLCSVKFNPKQTQLLATGDELGTVMIWKLSDEFTKQTPNEQKLLDQVADSALEEAEN
jgi:WD40 repeat protein